VWDRSGRQFSVTLKTWQNMVCGLQNPTFVLEQTAAFQHVNKLRRGDSVGIAKAGGRLLLVTGVAVESCGHAAGDAASRRAMGQPCKRGEPSTPVTCRPSSCTWRSPHAN
jgi:hypothetical protein